jgi:ribosomal-protein-alanine N-acetyltransferase
MMIIETPRLYLRKMVESDAQHAYELNLDPEVIKYTGDASFENIKEARDFLINYDHYKKYGFGRWAVIRKLDWCGIKYNPELDEYDIGFRFFKKYWGKGYATESAKACIDWVFQNIDTKEIIGRAMPQNIASYKVLEKVGLKHYKTIEMEHGQLLIYKICDGF